jgi:Zn2+/Cd2+-exporting ATPase
MTEQTFHIGNMDCANCAREVETAVARLDGVNAVRVDFTSGKMRLDGDVPIETLRERVQALGKSISTEEIVMPKRRGGVLGFCDHLVNRNETRLALAGGAMILLALGLDIVTDTALVSLVYVLAMATAAYPIARSGINTLRISREFSINLLMIIAAVGAIVIGEYLEAATVIFLFAIGEALEGYTADRARDSLRSLVALKPRQAVRLDDDGTETVIAVDDLCMGDRVLVKPGEQIPSDGEVIEGRSSVNQATITGESMPVNKTAGDTVFAGTLNQEGGLTVRITRTVQDNTLNRIIELVEEAQSARSPSQRIIDRFAHYYTPAVVIVALLAAVLPPLIVGAPFLDTPDTRGWLYRALTILVIGCPCALVISTPVTVISAITAAARQGVLIKGGIHLETLGRIRAIAFDKTGTLTRGRPAVQAVRSLECEQDAGWCANCEDVLALAAAVERRSTHPLADAVMTAARDRHLEGCYAAAENVQNMAGQGIQGRVNGHAVTVGSHAYFDRAFPHQQDLCQKVDAVEAQGQTTMMVHDGDRVRGYISVADQVRDESREVVRQLNALGIETVMLTGDNATAAAAVSKAIGLTAYRSNLMPEDKVDAVKTLPQKPVAMVGDGVNDTPALAAADVGIAMGGAGSAQALETADVVLMAHGLRQLPFAVRVSRFARRLIRQNIGLTFFMKMLFLLLALGGGVTMWMAVFADMGMSLIVTLNGTRPLRIEN